MKVFISSVQKEFEAERAALGEFIAGDALLRRQFETFLIQRYGTGTGDMIRRCIEVGLPEPEFQLNDGFVTILRRPSKAQAGTNSSAGRAQDEAQKAQDEAQEGQIELTSLETTLLQAASNAAQTGNELLIAAGYKSRTGNFKRAMEKLLAANLLAMTLPDTPRSKNQQYRATEKGRSLLKELQSGSQKGDDA